MNLPITMASDFMLWGKQFSNFKNEFESVSKNSFNITNNGLGTNYVADELKDGVAKTWVKKAATDFFKNGATEGTQEGLQFITSEGSKSWYGRKFDDNAQRDFGDFADTHRAYCSDFR